MRRSGEDERWRGGQPIKKYGKKEERMTGQYFT